LDLSNSKNVIFDIVDGKKKFIFKITAFTDSFKLQAASKEEMDGKHLKLTQFKRLDQKYQRNDGKLKSCSKTS
jgi:hypothetical protein